MANNECVNFQRVQVPYGRESRPEPLASHKAAWGNPYAEGSETAKTGTEEHEPDKRLIGKDEVPQHTNVQPPQGETAR